MVILGSGLWWKLAVLLVALAWPCCAKRRDCNVGASLPCPTGRTSPRVDPLGAQDRQQAGHGRPRDLFEHLYYASRSTLRVPELRVCSLEA